VKGEVAFGLLAGDIGYLRINGFADYANDGDFWAGMAELETALDDIFSQSFNGLVIDIRANDGGSDLYGLAVASRLTQTPYPAYTIEARSNPTDPTQWTTGQPILVQSSLCPGYDGPVILLTSRYSVSAAETFTMALMGRTPEVRRLGENTQGVFSVVLVHILPNGWWFGLQNERFLTGDGLTFDGAGIPPHINVSIFPPSDLAAGQDSALATAVQLLNQ
jgi:C-terminal processing protease CtpA/Prc